MTTQELICIRPAAAEEGWAVQRLFAALHTHNAALDACFALADGWAALLDAHLEQTTASGTGLTLLAWEADTPVGLLMMSAHADSPLFRHRRWVELLALYVAPEARGRSTADRLLSEGLAWTAAQGYNRVQLFVTASNLPARRFYQRAGFRCAQEIWRLDLLGSIPA
ncbi:MAG TPA: GNAT family N-acetyltransferase [Roseiflexaceae bacterium]|nr:GNAT family N-acetyltransferase [Roseiflexaceae bacterium]